MPWSPDRFVHGFLLQVRRLLNFPSLSSINKPSSWRGEELFAGADWEWSFVEEELEELRVLGTLYKQVHEPIGSELLKAKLGSIHVEIHWRTVRVQSFCAAFLWIALNWNSARRKYPSFFFGWPLK